MNVIFHYRAGHTKPMAERFAKILQGLGHGYYRTDEPEPILLTDPVVVPDPVAVHQEIAEQARELPVVFKAKRGPKPKHRTDND